MNNGRYRIVSDGTGLGTKIYEPDGRQMDVSWITKVEWSIEGGGGIGFARLTIANVEVDVVGDEPKQSAQGPATGE
jgi:hypothetical protein